MAFVKKEFIDNKTKIMAEDLNSMQDAILELYERTQKKKRSVTLYAAAWEGDTSPYSQVVVIDGVTPNTQVDVTLSGELYDKFLNKTLGIVIENHDGVTIAMAAGQKPTKDYTIQVTLSEVIE